MVAFKDLPPIRVLSRSQAEAYFPPDGAVCISINERGMSVADLSPRFAAVLRLVFDDIDGEHGAGWIPFANEHAERILRFVDEHRDAREIVVHCTMGVSRSAGVALGVMDAHRFADEQAEKRMPLHNRRVRSFIRRYAVLNPEHVQPSPQGTANERAEG